MKLSFNIKKKSKTASLMNYNHKCFRTKTSRPRVTTTTVPTTTTPDKRDHELKGGGHVNVTTRDLFPRNWRKQKGNKVCTPEKIATCVSVSSYTTMNYLFKECSSLFVNLCVIVPKKRPKIHHIGDVPH